MKKLKIYLVAALLLIIAAIAPKAQLTKAEEDVFIIYAQIPDDWKEPCLWAWNSDGTNAFEAWPGEKMTADPNNEGWYYCYVPGFVTNAIVNANDASVQTGDMEIESVNTWLQIQDAENVTVSKDALTQGDLPKYEEKTTTTDTKEEITDEEVKDEEQFTVYAKVPQDWLSPCLWAWSAPDGTNVFANWPGQELTLEDGWYTYSVPTWVNSIIINGNLGGVQTTDLSVEGKDVWITVTDPENVEVVYEKPTDDAVSEATDVEENTDAATKEQEEAEETTTEVTEKEDTNMVPIIVAIVAVVLVATVVTIVVVKRKKSN